MRSMRPARLLRLALPLGLLLLVAAPADARRSSTYVDKVHGFSLKLPNPARDWSQTPLQPGEDLEVAKFKDDREGNFSTLSIYRFEVEGAEVTTPGDGETPARPEVRLPPQYRRPATAKAYLERDLQWKYKRWGRDWEGLPEAEREDFGDAEGDIYEIEFELKGTGYKFGYLAGIIRNETEEYLILFSRRDKLKKVLRAWTKSIRSFRFADADREVEEEDVEDRGHAVADESDLLDPEKRERVKQALVGSWQFIDTPHYIIVYNCDERLAKHIAKRIEYMREFAFEVVFPPVEPIQECMVVRVCKEMDEYHHYGGPGGSAGYWSSGHDELVFPDLSRSKKPDEQTLGVLNHEGFHQYIHYALLKNNLPIWFNEGFAEYFFCVESTRSKLKFMKRHPMRYGTVKSALGTDKLIPLKDFIKMNQRQYYSRASLCYAQGWAFSTWMKNVTKDEKYQQIPEIMFQEMQKGYLEQSQAGPGGRRRGMWGEYNAVVKAAMEKAFEGIDIEEMDEAFRKDLKRKM